VPAPAKKPVTWTDLKTWMDGMDEQLKKMPAPPVPRDSWGEKVNIMYRALEGMREQLRSEIENEQAHQEWLEQQAGDAA